MKKKPYSRKNLDSILAKPSGPDCNMHCAYCFYLKKEELFTETHTHRMSEEILEQMIRQVMTQAGEHIAFGWQGGEPTLMGLPFFEKAVKFQQQYGRGQAVGNGLQTNGILINDKWAAFLEKYNFLVGLSLDGPEHIHNRYRFMRGGQKSWNRVMDSAKLMLDNNVQVNALIVLNEYSAQFPEEIYKFNKDLGLNYMQFIPCVETDPRDTTKVAPFSVSPENYGNALCTLFDLWQADFVENRPTTSIRYFDSVFYNYVGLPPPECTLLKECGNYVVVEHNGNVYSCDFFVEPEWKLGNIMQDNLTNMLNSSKQRKFGRLKSMLPEECRTCHWLHYCRGGCTKDRLHDTKSRKLNYLCNSYKMFFEHADARLKKMADEWKHEQEAI